MTALATLVVIHWLALITPGPNVVVVVHAAVSRSRAAAVGVATGIAVGALVWASTAALGLAVLVDRIGRLQLALRLAGGLVLLVIGLLQLRRSRTPEAPSQERSRARLVLSGLIVNLTNPKSVIFFGSVFAAVLPVDASLTFRGAAIAVIVADALIFHLGLALAFSVRRARRFYVRYQERLRRLVGAVFVAFGARLAWSGRLALL